MTGWTESRVFVDTNILIYAIDADAGEKHVRAQGVIEEIWLSKSGVISTQILSELTVNLRKKLHMKWGDIRQIVEPYQSWTVIGIEQKDPLLATKIAEEHGTSYWDALVLRASIKSKCAFLLTEDLNPGQEIEGIKVINPLKDQSG